MWEGKRRRKRRRREGRREGDEDRRTVMAHSQLTEGEVLVVAGYW